MRLPASALGLALAGLIALAGCGQDGDPVDDDARSSPASESATASSVPESERPSEPSPSAPALSDLATRAEEEAGRTAALGDRVLGGDIGWPQCPKGMGIPERRTLGLPLPPAQAEYVIIGLTNGPGFTENPCLADQVGWAKKRRLPTSAYAVVSYPLAADLKRYRDAGPYDGSTRLGALRNNGYAQAERNVAAMRKAGLPSPAVWIDVEPVPAPFPWSADIRANAAVVTGTARAYSDAGLRIGVYSTPLLWEEVVGGLRLDLPEWRAAGESSRQEALERCGPDWQIQGGEPVLAQWLENDRDLNLTCPGADDPGSWFHQF